MKSELKTSRFLLSLAAGMIFCLGSAAAAHAQNGEINIHNTAKAIGHGYYECIIFIETDSNTLRSIKDVKYTLHPSLSKSKQTISSTRDARFPLGSDPFRASEEFSIKVKIEFQGQRGDASLTHTLKLFNNPRTH